MKRKLIFFMILFISLIPIYYSSVSGDSSYELEAILYDTDAYSGGTGTELTESGAIINGWQYSTSKYLQVNPFVPDDGNTYTVTVKMPQELYAVTNAVVTPVGYSSATFTKNESIKANDDATTYNLKNFSGTFQYTLQKGMTGGTIQLEIQYDRILWDKLANSALTKDGIKPIEVILTNETTGEIIKTLSVKEAYSNGAFPIGSMYNNSIVNGYTYTATSVDLLVANQVTYRSYMITSSQVAETLFYKKLQYVINLPKYTKNEVTYYPDLDLTNVNYGKYKPMVDTSELANGKLTLTYTDVYYSTSDRLYQFYINFPEALKDSTDSSFSFTGGNQSILISDKNGNMKTLKNGTFPSYHYKAKAEENVTLGVINKTTTLLDRPDEAISLLGGFNLRNAGYADSEQKNFKVNFDIDDTNLIKVTTILIPTDNISPTTDIKYTLVDNDGNNVCISDVCEWTYHLTNNYYNKSKTQNQGNLFHRGLLPEEQNQYFFKSIEYSLASLPSETYLFSSGGSNGYTSKGNFFGYINENAYNGNTAKSTISMTSENFSTIERTSTTTVSSSSSTAYGVNKVKVDKSSIYAGSSVVVTGTVAVSSYPYGICTWMRDIVLGVVLPEGITINEPSVYGYTKSINNKLVPTQITNEPTSDGKVLWKIYFDHDIVLGYANELTSALSEGDSLNFSMQFDTAFYMNQQTINLIDSLFAASTSQTNSASGGWGWANKTDTYDINGNGSKTDKIGGLNTNATGVTFEITPQKATFDITDSIEITEEGSIGEESKEASIISENDTISYKLKLDCTSGGTVENFSYHIPIPKKNYINDNYLITSTDNVFDMKLTDKLSITGSDLYEFYYTLDDVNYNTKDNEGIRWYSSTDFENQNLNYEDVTMIRLLPKVEVIPNGSSTNIIIPLKYSGDNYASEAGKSYTFHGAGYFTYIINGRDFSGNFSSDGVTVHLEYEENMEDFEFMLTKDETVAVTSYETSDVPIFVNDQTYQITNVEVSGVTLQTKSYINANKNMESVLANTNFAITVKLNDGTEKEILANASTNPVNIGKVNASEITKLKYQIYYADTIGALYLDKREVIVTFTSDSGVTIKQKIIINSIPASASSPELAILAGKTYNAFDDKSTNVAISEDSAFTSQFVINYVPSNYGEKEIIFSEKLPIGTTLTMIDIINKGTPSYYYYNVNSTVDKLKLTDLTQMGTNHKYTYLNVGSEVEEIILLIVDFSRCEDYFEEGNYNIYLKFAGTAVEDLSSEKLEFNIQSKRTFNITSINEVLMGEGFNISYSSVASLGIESNYIGRKTSIILKAPNNIPLDTYIEIGTNKYYLNDEKEFILPFTDVQTTSDTLLFNMYSNMLPKQSSSYIFEGSLWVSLTANASSPKAGEKVKDFRLTVKSSGIQTPSVKISSLTERLIKNDSIAKDYTLTYDFIDDPTCISTIELHQKVGTSYQKVTNMLSRVNGNTMSDMGVYTITSTNGRNNVNFNLSSSMPNGTYRFIVRIKDTDGNELLSTPYNFMIIDK